MLPLTVWRLPGVGSLESLAGRVAGYVFTNLCGLPAPAAHVRGAPQLRRRHRQRQSSVLRAGDGSDREKWRETSRFD